MTVAGLIKDPAPPTTPGDGSEIRTDQHNIFVDLANGTDDTRFSNNRGPVRTETGNYTATEDDYTIRVNAVGGAITITLPDSALARIRKKIYVIKKIDSSANKVTIDGHSTQTIDGVQTTDLITQHETLIIQSDGTNWRIIGKFTKGFDDAGFRVYDDADTTKVLAMSLGGMTTGKTATLAFPFTDNRTITFPNATTTLAGLAVAQTFTQLQTFNAGITMSGSNITLGANKIITTGYDVFQFAGGLLGTGVGIIPSTGNGGGLLHISPKGTATSAHIQLFDAEADSTNYSTLVLSTNFNSTQHQIISYKGGTGTQKAIQFWMQATKIFSILADQTGAAIDATKRLYLDSGGDTFVEEVSADRISVKIGGNAGLDIAEPADTETALLIRRNVSGTLSLQRVSMGATDSGGSGFKVLRVPN
jgi:hypothetical protein